MSQVRSSGCMRSRLPLHQVDVFGRHGRAASVDGDDQSQADGRFRGGDGEDDDGERLAGDQRRRHVAPEGHQVDVDGVQHQLDAHQNGDGVAAAEHAIQADAEEPPRRGPGTTREGSPLHPLRPSACTGPFGPPRRAPSRPSAPADRASRSFCREGGRPPAEVRNHGHRSSDRLSGGRATTIAPIRAARSSTEATSKGMT